ncbi:MAG: alternative ribosome rescue aminoacyl-tRNA hydrolase ArfB [Halocynthiibacter sp.]
MIHVTDDITIADWEYSENFVRASGPGGQHVNKVSTAVELRFEAARSPNLLGPVKARLRKIAGRKWTLEGAIVIYVDETRSQSRNRAIAKERLSQMILAALVKPKRRIKTRPTRASQTRRLNSKTKHGQLKASRQKSRDFD